jgi:hypothetical protein
VIASIVYGWTTVVWFWQLPSWLLSLALGEIVSIFAYVMLSALAESLTLLVFLLVLAWLLPAKLYRDKFLVKSVWFTISSLGLTGILFYASGKFHFFLVAHFHLWFSASILLSLLFAFWSSRVSSLGRSALWLADRFSVFLFVTTPLSIISLIVVALRNFL